MLDRLKEYEVKINFEKSEFSVDRVEILGHMIEDGELKVITKSLEKIMFVEDKVPSKKEVQGILGVINWYRTFIPDVSRRIESISRLLAKDCKEVWGDEQTKALESIKKDISEKAHLKLPDCTKVFRLQCDASDQGIGAVLFQDHGVIGYYSKKFSNAEKNYTIVEKEMFGIIKTLDFFRTLIQGYSILIETDSRNCTFVNKQISKRTERWKLLLNEFDFTLKNIPGEQNNVADRLSRCFLVKTVEKKLTLKEMISKNLEKMGNEFKRNENNKFIVKEDQKYEFVKKIHEFSVHAGMSCMYYNITPHYYFKRLKKTIKEVVRNCETCLRNKKNKARKTVNYHITSKRLGEVLCSDIFGPFELEEYGKPSHINGNRGFFLTITDVFSRITNIDFY